MSKITFDELCKSMDTDMLEELVNECNSWNDSLEEYQVYSFDEEFFELYFSGNVIDAVRATYFGNIQNWRDEYIRFNAYGNLESMNEWQYHNMLKENVEDIVETSLDLYQDGNLSYLSDAITELFDAYLEDEVDG